MRICIDYIHIKVLVAIGNNYWEANNVPLKVRYRKKVHQCSSLSLLSNILAKKMFRQSVFLIVLIMVTTIQAEVNVLGTSIANFLNHGLKAMYHEQLPCTMYSVVPLNVTCAPLQQ